MAIASLPRFRKRQAPTATDESAVVTDSPTENGHQEPNAAAIKRGTTTRRTFIYISCFFYLVAIIFLILCEVGTTSGARVKGDIYFFKLDLSDILVTALPAGGLTLTNSIARTLGLHDFYQVGLWSFCEGYNDTGITYCSQPNARFWFNPVEILLSELFAGAAIALPSEVNDVLRILRIASHIMFGFYLAGLLLIFVLMLIAPVVIFSRWWSLPFSIFSFIATLMITVGTILGTAMSVVFKYALSSQPDFNIRVDLGTKMVAFSWVATGFTLLAFFFHAGMCCCCTSRRDMKTHRKGGRDIPPAPRPEEEK